MKIMRPLRAITVTFERELYDYYKNFLYYTLRNLITPTLYILVIGMGLGSMVHMSDDISYIQFLIPGILMMTIAQVTHHHFSFEVWAAKNYEKYLETLTMIAPIRPSEAVIGYLLAGVMIAIFTVISFLIPIYIFFRSTLISLPLLLLFTLGLGILFSATGFVTGIYFDDAHHLNIANSFIIIPLSFLCGVFFPLDLYPEPIRFLIELVPLTQAIEGLRGNAILLLQIGYVWITAVIAAIMAILVFKRKMII